MSIRRVLMAQMAGNGSIKVDFIKRYTVAESWENDTKGNPIAIFSALGLSTDDLTDNSQAYVCVFKNNQAASSNYKCDYLYRLKTSDSSNIGSGVVRNNKSAVRSFVQNTSAWASIGTIIEVYKITYSV